MKSVTTKRQHPRKYSSHLYPDPFNTTHTHKHTKRSQAALRRWTVAEEILDAMGSRKVKTATNSSGEQLSKNLHCSRYVFEAKGVMMMMKKHVNADITGNPEQPPRSFLGSLNRAHVA
eukprot:scaffold186186_cov20-Tisochrysis_lutea.AAC.1